MQATAQYVILSLNFRNYNCDSIEKAGRVRPQTKTLLHYWPGYKATKPPHTLEYSLAI
jgi:hypothetical protein